MLFTDTEEFKHALDLLTSNELERLGYILSREFGRAATENVDYAMFEQWMESFALQVAKEVQSHYIQQGFAAAQQASVNMLNAALAMADKADKRRTVKCLGCKGVFMIVPDEEEPFCSAECRATYRGSW